MFLQLFIFALKNTEMTAVLCDLELTRASSTTWLRYLYRFFLFFIFFARRVNLLLFIHHCEFKFAEYYSAAFVIIQWQQIWWDISWPKQPWARGLDLRVTWVISDGRIKFWIQWKSLFNLWVGTDTYASRFAKLHVSIVIEGVKTYWFHYFKLKIHTSKGLSIIT